MRAYRPFALCAALLSLSLSGAALAQGAAVGFSGLKQDPGAQVEVTADQLTLDRAAGGAVLEGNVLVVQGNLRMTAARIDVRYKADGTGVEHLQASGGVTLVTATDAAEAQAATYDVASGALVMTGNVLLTQGPTVISGEKLIADLRAGTGRMEGRVKTLFNTDGKAAN